MNNLSVVIPSASLAHPLTAPISIQARRLTVGNDILASLSSLLERLLRISNSLVLAVV